jgi:ABC-2 type transport system permease protein
MNQMIRLILRRERFVIPLWMLLLVGLAAGQVTRYQTIAEIAAFAREMTGNAALSAFAGEVPAATVAGMAVWKNGDAIYTILGLIMILTVIRHTRGEEDSGRAELVGSGVVGRLAPLTAALAVTFGAAVLTGLLTALAMIKVGCDPAGSFAFGAGIAATGLVFAAVGALAAQIGGTVRAAIGLGAAALGLGYLLRFAADGSGLAVLKFLSPQGWSHLVRPYGANDVAILLVSLAVTTAVAGLACRLNSRRDLGRGLLAERPGPAGAARLALTWRLHRGLLTGWTLAYAVAALVLGALAASIEDVSTQGAAIAEFFHRYTASPEATMTDAYLWLISLSLGYVSALYPLLALLRLRAEEVTGRAELLLSGSLSRLRWAGGHLIASFAGSALILTVAGLVTSLVTGRSVLPGTLVQIPATWLMAGVGLLAFAVLPKAAAAVSWAAFLFVNLFGEVLGPIIGLDYRVAKYLVPYPNLPMVISGEEFTAAPVLVMLGLTAVLCGGGLAVLRARDL